MEKWHARTADETLQFWQTDVHDGLTSQEAKSRLDRFGFNEMREKAKTSWWKRFIAQFQDFMVLVLLAATLISALLGEYVDAITILAIVITNAILGFLQEYRAEQSMQALKELSAPTARVVRNGNIQHIPARELVPGDIMMLEAGDKLAADGRLLEVHSLELDEAALTGESSTIRKIADRNYEEDASLGDRKNMVYAGTITTKGRGKAIVCATGMLTEVGNIAGMIQDSAEEDTPLERRLAQLGRLLVWGCLLICLLVVVIGTIKGEPLFLMCMAGISLAVAAIPEGLPAVVTVALALGMQRMIKRSAIIRKLPAVETLGCTTVICSDKTGTLTQNAMTARKVFSNGRIYEITGAGYDIKGNFLNNKKEINIQYEKTLQQCLIIGALCNNTELKQHNVILPGLWRGKENNGWSVEGDPTEGALIVAAAKAGIWRANLEKIHNRIAEVPFDSERRRMSVIYKNKDDTTCTLYIKGAVDTILDLCTHYKNGHTEIPLHEAERSSILKANDEMTNEALRVLALAQKKLPSDQIVSFDESIEHNLVFIGLIGMIDPPREEAREAIHLCRMAGIKTVMITGDHRNTAIAIGQELKIYNENQHKVLTGKEIDALNDKDLGKIVNDVSIYARVSPSHKLRIVRALKQRGHIVAMTGDGVNDAPAIKEADIGVAMGITGTDVTKEASSMILADDNFATIVAAVEEGRGIYDNIRKFIRYLLSCNIGEVLTMFLASLAGLPLPLLPVQILWINLVTDGLPAMALGIDPSPKDIMNRSPRNPSESVFSRGLGYKIIGRGIQIGLSTLFVFSFVYYLKNDLALARTMAFFTLVFCQLFHVFDCRSERFSIFQVGFFSNKYLIAAVGVSAIMQIAVIYTQFLRDVFSTVPMSLTDWLLIIIVSGWTFITGFLRHLFGRTLSAKSVFNRI